MHDPVTLDQLRTLVAVAEAGSFSGAARRLQRVQSAVSTAMANLEGHLGVVVFDRAPRVPALTDAGRAVLASARRVIGEVDGLRRLTSDLADGLEAHVSLCVDALFPVPALVELCASFARTFPSVDLRVDTQTLSAVSERVLSGSSTLGVVSPLGIAPGLERKVLGPVRMIPVVEKNHPLARKRGPLSVAAFADCVQIVLSERHDDGVPDQAVLSPRTWRVADLHTKHALLRAGLGWGNLPAHLVEADLKARRLVAIHPSAWGEDEHVLYLSAVYRADAAFGRAHRWALAELERLCVGRPRSRVAGKSR
ncbi:MAG: LysR family transcriptional regulator [Myxococcales bacterium]|nr:LysR family transcriptional regulator [Myxococcales bacterium]